MSPLFSLTPHECCPDGAHLDLLVRNSLQSPINLLVLLQEDERRNGLGSQTDEAGCPSAECPADAFLPTNLLQQTQETVAVRLRGRSAHDTGLDHIGRTADGGCYKPCQERSREVCCQIVRHAELVDAEALEAVVRREL